MKVLIAIPSCHSLRGNEDSVRNTWIKDIPKGVDYKFFLGNPNVPVSADEVCLDVGDGFNDITQKVKRIFGWAHDHGYDFVFKCDLDTLVVPALLMKSDFEKYDYSGGRFGGREFASGGGGYWLSRKAMGIVIHSSLEDDPWEDLNIARVLLARGIEVHDNPHHKFIPGERLDRETIAMHLSSTKGWDAKATPEDMYRAYRSIPAEVAPVENYMRSTNKILERKVKRPR